MKDRIKQVMDYKGMAQINFANFIGVSPASLSSIFNGRTRPTLNIVEAIKSKIPEINTDWLLFGNGSMINGDGAEPDLFATSPTDGNETEGVSSAQQKIAQAAAANPAILDFAPEEHEGEKNNVVKIIDKPQRKIAEIRVYFDDQTFESFVPSE